MESASLSQVTSSGACLLSIHRTQLFVSYLEHDSQLYRKGSHRFPFFFLFLFFFFSYVVGDQNKGLVAPRTGFTWSSLNQSLVSQ